MQEIRGMRGNEKLQKREKTILQTSAFGIIVNLLLAVAKAGLGFLSGSIAILTDAANNLSEVMSSLITVIGMKAAMLRPDHAHPFGHGRFEYLSSMIIGNIILLTGIFALKESIEKMVHPEEVSCTTITVALMIAAVAVKLFLAVYFRHKGKETSSDALMANGKDSESDALLTGAVIISLTINLLLNIQIEAYISILIAALITWNGVKIMVDMVTTLLGKGVSEELCRKLNKKICTETAALDVKNLVLHDYGPLTTIGSLDVQVDAWMSADKIAKLETQIKEIASREYGVRLTSVGIYV
ncbi:MAG: cation diffusion facilitator family transporter [Lachnospiraceae bacterium]|nr:cation diffusion facilitator family transporter [Lachnospiraceae bacterium]